MDGLSFFIVTNNDVVAVVPLGRDTAGGIGGWVIIDGLLQPIELLDMIVRARLRRSLCVRVH